MPEPLDIDADLTLNAPDGSMRIRSQGRGVKVDVTSLRVLKRLPGQTRTLASLRRLGRALALADQSVAVRARGLDVIELDPALRGRWLGRLLRVPGLRVRFFNWLRARG